MTTPDKRAALEAQIQSLEAKLALAPAPNLAAVAPPPPAAPIAPTAPVAAVSGTPATPPINAKRSTPIGLAVPAPMFSNTPGVMHRARPAPPAAAPAVAAPAAAAPAVAESAPAASRQRPIVLPRAAPGQLPRIGAAPTIHGMPKPAQARATVGSSYMRPRPKRTST